MSKRSGASTKQIKSVMYRIYGKRCMLCGFRPKKKSKNFLTYHHIVDYSLGGPTNEENGAILCDECHRWFNAQSPKIQNQLNMYFRKRKKEIKESKFSKRSV